MEQTTEYGNAAERVAVIAVNEALGLRMLHDDFPADWVPGEVRGTLTFTDVLPSAPVKPRWEALDDRLKVLEAIEAARL